MKILSSAKRVKLKRVAPGYYVGKTTLLYDDKEIPVEVSISSVEGERKWYFIIEDKSINRYSNIGGDDWYNTKAEAVMALQEVLSSGVMRTSWGWVSK